MQAKLARIVIEALILMFVYACAEYLWRDRALTSDTTGLLLVGASYIAVSVAAFVLGSAWRR